MKNLKYEPPKILTKEKFDLMKKLLSSGIEKKVIAQAIGFNSNSIGTWNRFKTFEDYENYKRSYANRKRQKIEKKEIVSIVEKEDVKDVKPVSTDSDIPIKEEKLFGQLVKLELDNLTKIVSCLTSIQLSLNSLVRLEIEKENNKKKYFEKKRKWFNL